MAEDWKPAASRVHENGIPSAFGKLAEAVAQQPQIHSGRIADSHVSGADDLQLVSTDSLKTALAKLNINISVKDLLEVICEVDKAKGCDINRINLWVLEL